MITATLPATWYVDEEIHQLERKRIFARNWTLFGPEADLMQPGTWRAETVNGWPILVVRADDRELRAFHNVCRHRGAMLVAEGRGDCRQIVCPYHAWTYDLTGKLLGAPRFGDMSDFSFSDYGLFPLRVATWAGLVFVCMDADAVDLMTWLGPLPRLCDSFPGPGEMDFHGAFAIEGEANWKTYCDNTVEGYHLPTVHRRLNRAVVSNETTISSYDDGRLVVFDVTYVDDLGTLRGPRGIWFYRFPGFQGTAGQRAFKAERIEPLGPRRQRSLSWAWYRDLAPEERLDAFEWAKSIVREDLSVCESVQRNMAAGIFQSGLLSPLQEQHTARFQALVREAVGEPGRRLVAE
jgi:choline monooxygenase